MFKVPWCRGMTLEGICPDLQKSQRGKRILVFLKRDRPTLKAISLNLTQYYQIALRVTIGYQHFHPHFCIAPKFTSIEQLLSNNFKIHNHLQSSDNPLKHTSFYSYQKPILRTTLWLHRETTFNQKKLKKRLSPLRQVRKNNKKIKVQIQTRVILS